MRDDKRAADEMRQVTIEPGFQRYPDGSVLVSFGDTRVICSASGHDSSGQQVPRLTITILALSARTCPASVTASAALKSTALMIRPSRLVTWQAPSLPAP